MAPETIDLATLIYRYYCTTIDQRPELDAVSGNCLSDFALQIAKQIRLSRDLGSSRDEKVASLLDRIQPLLAAHSEDECAQVRLVCQKLMLMADNLPEDTCPRRGDDPPHADPGGGMRSPGAGDDDHWADYQWDEDEWEDDERDDDGQA